VGPLQIRRLLEQDNRLLRLELALLRDEDEAQTSIEELQKENRRLAKQVESERMKIQHTFREKGEGHD
jgi:hypothetical protein